MHNNTNDDCWADLKLGSFPKFRVPFFFGGGGGGATISMKQYFGIVLGSSFYFGKLSLGHLEQAHNNPGTIPV